MKSWYLEIKAQYFGLWFALSIVRLYTIQVNPLTGNQTNLSDRKWCAEKLSAGISISVGWPVVTTWVTICCLFDQFWSNFSYFTDLSGMWMLIMVTNTKVFQLSLFFLDFSRDWLCFLMSSASNYRAECSNNSTFKVCGAGFTSLKDNLKQKLSFYKETYGNSAILYWPVRF